MLITDGKQTIAQSLTNFSGISQRIKDRGIIVYALGVGSSVDQSQLLTIASSSDVVFFTSSFTELAPVVSQIQGKLCNCKYLCESVSCR